MRVLHLIDSLAAHGAERSLVTLAPYLLDRGVHYEVAHLMERDDLAPALTERGIRVHDLSGPDNRGDQARRVASLLEAMRPSVLHTTLYRSDVSGRPAARSLGIPSVTTWASSPQLHGNLLLHMKRRRTTALDRWTARTVARFHAVSQPVADVVGRQLGIAPDRIDVIPRGRDPVALGQRSPQRRRRWRNGHRIGEAPMILSLGRHEPAKALDVLIDAVAILRPSNPDLVVVLAGDFGSRTSALEAQIHTLGLEDAVRVVGQRHDVGDMLAAADVLAAPSLVEGLPGAIVEAMFVGTPVVASDIPTIRAAVPDAGHGWLVRPNDSLDLARALDEALQNRSGAIERSRRARTRAMASFSLPAIADATVRFYERALADSRVTVR